jgi:hypothetical protein
MKDHELAEILRAAHQHNPTNGVTGLLLCREGNFIQVLEGEPEQVEAMFASIERDPRHCQVIVLSRAFHSERVVAGWVMGFRHIEMISAENDRILKSLFSDPPGKVQASHAWHLIKPFARSVR